MEVFVQNRAEATSRKRVGLLASALFALAFTFSGTSVFAGPTPGVDPRFDYQDMFDLARQTMHRKPARDLLNTMFKDQLVVAPDLAQKYGYVGKKIPGFTETQMMMLLQEVPSIREELRAYLKAVPRDADSRIQTPALKALRAKWHDRFTAAFQDKTVLEAFLQKNDPLQPFVMTLAPGVRGYGPVTSYFTFDVNVKGKVRPADNVLQAFVDFIDRAKVELRFNVFDGDADEIADALIRAQKRGVRVLGGMDSGVLATTPKSKAFFDKLVAGGVPMTAVNSVALDHQKIWVRDWSIPEEAETALSTGNATNSCINPGGDAAAFGIHSPESVPNANVVNMYKSQTLALTAHNSVTKTVDPDFLERGEGYPPDGSYQIIGDPIHGKPRYMTIAFTPNGAFDDVEQNIIARVIAENDGPIHLAQFAFSSQKVEDALLAKAIANKNAGKPFELYIVGDRPFDMQDWSVPLNISGMRLEGTGDARKFIPIPDADNKWLQALGKDDYAKLLANIHNAPAIYANHTIKDATQTIQVNAKLHVKLMCVGPTGKQVCIFGSFNFSEGAEKNTEYIVVSVDDDLNELLNAGIVTLFTQGKNTVIAETAIENKMRNFDPAEGTEVDAETAGRSSKDVNVNCKTLLEPKPGFVPK